MRNVDLIAGQEFNQLTEILPKWQGWLATLVLSEEGHFVGNDGSSKEISNHLDLQLLLALRSKADVICTTGKTARAEAYKASRFAPLAFITAARESLDSVPAVQFPGGFPNIFITPPLESNPFEWANSELATAGHNSMLFEGGPASLAKLWGSKLPVQLVLSIANCKDPAAVHPAELLQQAISVIHLGDPLDELIIGSNLVTRWAKSPL